MIYTRMYKSFVWICCCLVVLLSLISKQSRAYSKYSSSSCKKYIIGILVRVGDLRRVCCCCCWWWFLLFTTPDSARGNIYQGLRTSYDTNLAHVCWEEKNKNVCLSLCCYIYKSTRIIPSILVAVPSYSGCHSYSSTWKWRRKLSPFFPCRKYIALPWWCHVPCEWRQHPVLPTAVVQLLCSLLCTLVQYCKVFRGTTVHAGNHEIIRYHASGHQVDRVSQFFGAKKSCQITGDDLTISITNNKYRASISRSSSCIILCTSYVPCRWLPTTTTAWTGKIAGCTLQSFAVAVGVGVEVYRSSCFTRRGKIPYMWLHLVPDHRRYLWYNKQVVLSITVYSMLPAVANHEVLSYNTNTQQYFVLINRYCQRANYFCGWTHQQKIKKSTSTDNACLICRGMPGIWM